MLDSVAQVRRLLRRAMLLVSLAVMTGTACTGGTPLPEPEVGTTDVTMDKNAFDPMVVTIQRGEKVRWINTETGSISHTSTSGDPADDDEGDLWDSGSVAAGLTFTRQFDEVGEFEYHCTFHWRMGMRNAMVIVAEVGDQQP